METKIKQFWEYFEKESFFILEKLKFGIIPEDKFEMLDYLLTNLHPKLQALVNRPPNGEAHFVFLTKGRLGLKIIITEILNNAPQNDHWIFKMGLPPWNNSLDEFCSHYKFLGSNIHIYDVYFDIYKIHSYSGKMNLQIYVEKNKRLPKNYINESMRVFLLFYLGDRLFFKKIALLKVAQRKYTHINFIHLTELKPLLEYSRVT